MAGYSGTPLARKLRLGPGREAYLDVPPESRVPVGIAASDLGGAAVVTRLPSAVDVALLFCPDRARLETRLPLILERMTPAGAVWVCWPKKAARVTTDLDGNAVRGIGLAAGVVDVKVAAVDEVWSGLKFVRRLSER